MSDQVKLIVMMLLVWSYADFYSWRSSFLLDFCKTCVRDAGEVLLPANYGSTTSATPYFSRLHWLFGMSLLVIILSIKSSRIRINIIQKLLWLLNSVCVISDYNYKLENSSIIRSNALCVTSNNHLDRSCGQLSVEDMHGLNGCFVEFACNFCRR